MCEICISKKKKKKWVNELTYIWDLCCIYNTMEWGGFFEYKKIKKNVQVLISWKR